jgi:hypothetical protein
VATVARADVDDDPVVDAGGIDGLADVYLAKPSVGEHAHGVTLRAWRLRAGGISSADSAHGNGGGGP